MKLGVLSTMRGVGWGGSETVWHLAAMEALSEGHEVTAILHPNITAASQIRHFQSCGGRLHSWNAISIARLQGLKEKVQPTIPTELLDSFDALLVSLGSLPSLGYVPGLHSALSRTRTPFALFCQFNSDHLPISANERAIVHDTMRCSRANIFLSRRNLAEARRQFAIDPPAAIILSNPVRQVLEAPLAWPPIEEPVRFACVARLETLWKGQDVLLDCLRSPKWANRPWELTLFGSGPDAPHIERLIRLFGLTDRVRCAGFVSDLVRVWTDHHVLVLPSHGEGLPLALLEAMMFGRPAVVTDVGGNRELVEDGITGFIAEGSTLYSLDQTLERAWNCRSNWRVMGQSAHAAVKSRSTEDPTKELLRLWVGLGGTRTS